MELLAHWWNGSWGTSTKRDIHVYRDGPRLVVDWSGDGGRIGGRLWRADPAAATAAVRTLIEADGGQRWRDVTEAHRPATGSPA